MELIQCVQLFARAGQLDGRAGNGLHGQGRATARITIHTGHDHTGHAHGLVKRLGGVDRVLPGHGVHDQQRFRRVCDVPDLADFLHQRFVNG